MKKILVICTGNSCRSQMAEGYLRQFAGDKAEVYSAGIEANGINKNAIRVMKEDGVDISLQTSNKISEYISKQFDFIITVCDHAKENCPVFPSTAIQLHHNFPDPAKVLGSEEAILNQFRKVRNEIKQYCFDFVQKM